MLYGELGNELWNLSLNLHNKSNIERIALLLYLKEYTEIIGKELLFKTLTNMLHVFFLSEDDRFNQLYVDLLIGVSECVDGRIDIGDVVEVIGQIFCICQNEQKEKLFFYVINNVNECKASASSTISLCNCFRFIYPEVSTKKRNLIISMLENMAANNHISTVNDSIMFTLQSLKEVVL